MKVPFHKPYIDENDIEGVVSVLKNGWLTMGEKTFEFERKFKEYIGVKNAVAVSSCTAGLHLALKALGLGEGDEVLIPAVTFVATAEVVRYFNAVPVLVDVERETHLMKADDLEPKITPRTKAIVPVHYAGQPCDMDAIAEIARAHNLPVVEDAAHSLPAWYRGKKVGGIGEVTVFSFYATKTLTTGEGGMVTTDIDEWAERMRVLRLHGISKDAWNRYSENGSWVYDVKELGYKYNMTDISASLGLSQLGKLEEMWRRRVAIAEAYNEAFGELEELILYEVKPDRVSSWHLYPLKLKLEALKINREQFLNELKARGVSASVHFIPIYRLSYYRNMGYDPGDFPNSEWVFERTLSLPIFQGMTEREVEYVIESVTDIVRKNRR